MEADGLFHPTFFEFLFGMAVTAFADAGVEYAVLETGLGGRLDATNAVEAPVCSVITSIGWDHMALLGNTLEEIAAEKAGILKPGTPLFFFENGNGSDTVIENRAETLGISCKKIGKNAFKILGIEQKRIAFSCVSAYYEDIIWSLHNTCLLYTSIALCGVAVSVFAYVALTDIAIDKRVISNYFGNIAFAYEDYGFPYCFTASLFNTGISEPVGYSEETMAKIGNDGAITVNETGRSEEELPNILFVQLESYFRCV